MLPPKLPARTEDCHSLPAWPTRLRGRVCLISRFFRQNMYCTGGRGLGSRVRMAICLLVGGALPATLSPFTCNLQALTKRNRLRYVYSCKHTAVISKCLPGACNLQALTKRNRLRYVYSCKHTAVISKCLPGACNLQALTKSNRLRYVYSCKHTAVCLPGACNLQALTKRNRLRYVYSCKHTAVISKCLPGACNLPAPYPE